MPTPKTALEWLYKELRSAKIAKGHAERRPGVTKDETDNLDKKIAAVEFLIDLVLKCM